MHQCLFIGALTPNFFADQEREREKDDNYYMQEPCKY